MNEEYTITKTELERLATGKVISWPLVVLYGRIKQQCHEYGACTMSASALGKEQKIDRTHAEHLITKLKKKGLIKTRAVKGMGRSISCTFGLVSMGMTSDYGRH